VATAAHRYREIAVAAEVERHCHIGCVATARDRTLVNHDLIDFAGVLKLRMTLQVF